MKRKLTELLCMYIKFTGEKPKRIRVHPDLYLLLREHLNVEMWGIPVEVDLKLSLESIEFDSA